MKFNKKKLMKNFIRTICASRSFCINWKMISQHSFNKNTTNRDLIPKARTIGMMTQRWRRQNEKFVKSSTYLRWWRWRHLHRLLLLLWVHRVQRMLRHHNRGGFLKGLVMIHRRFRWQDIAQRQRLGCPDDVEHLMHTNKTRRVVLQFNEQLNNLPSPVCFSPWHSPVQFPTDWTAQLHWLIERFPPTLCSLLAPSLRKHHPTCWASSQRGSSEWR